MARALTVKVSVAKVIKALETKLAETEKDFAEQEAKEAKYKKAYDAWQKQAAKILVASFSKAENIRIASRYNGKTNIDFDIPNAELPTQPERDFTQLQEWRFREIKEEITNALRILRMTDEEFVSTSTMKSISQYL